MNNLNLKILAYMSRMQSRKNSLILSIFIASLILSGLALVFNQVAKPTPEEVIESQSQAVLSETEKKASDEEVIKEYQKEINAIVLDPQEKDKAKLTEVKGQYHDLLFALMADKVSFKGDSLTIANSIIVELSGRINTIGDLIKAIDGVKVEAPVEVALLPIDPDSIPKNGYIPFREIRKCIDDGYAYSIRTGMSKEEALEYQAEFVKNFGTTIEELNRMVGYGPVGEEKQVVASAKTGTSKATSTTKAPTTTNTPTPAPTQPVIDNNDKNGNGIRDDWEDSYAASDGTVSLPSGTPNPFTMVGGASNVEMSKYGYPVRMWDKNGVPERDSMDNYLKDDGATEFSYTLRQDPETP